MSEPPSSGNRWEPSETQPIAATPAAASAPGSPGPMPPATAPTPVLPPPAPAAAPAPPSSGAGWRTWPASVWTAIVAVAVAAFLACGIAGYAVGRASQHPDPATSVFGPGQDGGHDGGQFQGPNQDPNQGQGFGTQP